MDIVQRMPGTVVIRDIYGSDDANRLSRTLRLLTQHDISLWALTGGTAIELYLRQIGAQRRCGRLLD